MPIVNVAFGIKGNAVSMSDELLIDEMTVEAILKRWPQTAKVFHHYSSLCIGCFIARYCTISDVTKLNNLSPEAFIYDLKNATHDGNQGVTKI